MIIKCKMCGGDLNIQEGNSICECEFCGTSQTIPQVDNEKKGNLFNRANRLRMSADFDKASAVYASIAAEFPEEAEAYWGLCLCKYGIEYVDDPATGKKIPTCHRTLSKSIMKDDDFDQACENTDPVAARMYREEAKEIDRLQKEILSIASSESPYDVFICYKETDENGERTEDSVLAHDIYDALTGKGLKVFFARITLEEKLGKQYEPYIYAALSSAKVMLAVGTKFEYYNAVWVKNEWSRFLAMMKTDKSKTLIPCYKNLDAYDIPEEFSNLQAQDMAKLGWMQDLTRGVMKLCGKEEKAAAAPQIIQQVTTVGPTEESLLERAFMLLKDGKRDEAVQYAERVLDINPQNGRAYLVKLLADLLITGLDELPMEGLDNFEKNENYRKILQFGDEKLKAELSDFKKRIIQKKEQKQKTEENARAQQLNRWRIDEEAARQIAPWQDAIEDYSMISYTSCGSMIIVDANGKMYYNRKKINYDKSQGYWDAEKIKKNEKNLEQEEEDYRKAHSRHRFICCKGRIWLTEDGMSVHRAEGKMTIKPWKPRTYLDTSGTLHVDEQWTDGKSKKCEFTNIRRVIECDGVGGCTILVKKDGSCELVDFRYDPVDLNLYKYTDSYHWKNLRAGIAYPSFCLTVAEEDGSVFIAGDEDKIKELKSDDMKISFAGGKMIRTYEKKEDYPNENWQKIRQFATATVKLNSKKDEKRLYGLREDGKVMVVPGNTPVGAWNDIIQLVPWYFDLPWAIDIHGRIWRERQTLDENFQWGPPGRDKEIILFTSLEQLQEIQKRVNSMREGGTQSPEKQKFSFKGLFGRK